MFIQCSNTCKRQFPTRVNALISLYALTLLCQIQGSHSSDIKTVFCQDMIYICSTALEACAASVFKVKKVSCMWKE